MSDKRIELMPGLTLVIDEETMSEQGHTEIRALPGRYGVTVKVTAEGLTGQTGAIVMESKIAMLVRVNDE